MPLSLTTIIAPVVLRRTMPPVTGVGGRSLMTMVFLASVCSTMLGLSGLPSLASSGGSAGVSKRQPSHTGLSTSPPSNMTHTPAPGGGTMYTPIGPGGPDSGAQGSTQVVGTKPATSATVSISRARNSG